MKDACKARESLTTLLLNQRGFGGMKVRLDLWIFSIRHQRTIISEFHSWWQPHEHHKESWLSYCEQSTYSWEYLFCLKERRKQGIWRIYEVKNDYVKSSWPKLDSKGIIICTRSTEQVRKNIAIKEQSVTSLETKIIAVWGWWKVQKKLRSQKKNIQEFREYIRTLKLNTCNWCETNLKENLVLMNNISWIQKLKSLQTTREENL